MPILPVDTNDSPNYTPAQHADHHNILHAFNNDHPTDPLAHDGVYAASVLYLPGVAGNYVSTPDSAALSITGDIDIRVKVALDDWTPAANTCLLGKYVAAGSNISYLFYVGTSGLFRFQWTTNGTTASVVNSTVANSITNGATKWGRVTMDVDNGVVGNDVKFYTSDDGASWTQLGATVTTAGVTSIYDGTASVAIGAIDSGVSMLLAGNVYYAEIRNGIDGTIVGSYDSIFPASRYRDPQGNIWTVNGTANGWQKA